MEDNIICGTVGSVGCVDFPDVVGVGIVEGVRLRDVFAGCAVIDEIASAAYVQEDGFLGRLRTTYAAEDCFC